MNALFWLIGLILLLAVLFLLALLKPMPKTQGSKNARPSHLPSFQPTSDISPQLQTLLDKLTIQLPEFSLIAKTGQQQRILISRKNIQCAIVVLSERNAQRLMGQTLVIDTLGQSKHIKDIAKSVQKHFDKLYQPAN